ncbi:MAG TPA: bifunctional DNA-binding transcriptional regulator/O6-methylguanine-DNA methyltransferase Ada [Chloroflexota bacterium]|nr:bifunctional DNA-binding transcriptional regulator/O6-methylguanine-DNA methyltransferase Ada [Chloroflexota bacterium]
MRIEHTPLHDQDTEALDDAARWQAVLARDGQYDGRFFYGVRSTGIYCRPSCPSRRPRREQVRFFAASAAAEQAGFRPCRRCRPQEDAAPEVEVVRQVCRYIDEHPDGPVTLAVLGAHVGLSPYHLQRSFKNTMGATPQQYATARRIDRFKEQLKGGQAVTGAMYDAGYGSSSQLYTQAPARLGMTPTAYLKGGAGMNIHYTTATSPLGWLLVAATERGICVVRFGESAADLEQALAREFSAATLERDDAALQPWVDALARYLDGRQPRLDLPLDVQATAFQSRVWEALRAIPYGSTRSYSQIARAIGQPTAARAVAQACASNPAALIIPCHRVVRDDGSLSGYRWGVERKRSLLAREAQPAAPDATPDDIPSQPRVAVAAR